MEPSTISSRCSRLIRALGRGFGAAFGHYSPPPWLRWTGRSVVRPVRRRPIVTLSLLTLMAASGAGIWKWRQWEEAHRARAKVDEFIALRNLVVTAADPGPPPVDKAGVPQPSPLIIAFSDSAAPLEFATGPEAPSNTAGLDPRVEGRWSWASDRQLVFTPKAPWPAGRKFSVKLEPAALAAHTRIDREHSDLEIETARVLVTAGKGEFQTNENDPSVHQAVAEFRVSHPVTREALLEHVEVGVLGGSPVFQKAGTATSEPPQLELVADREDPARHFFLRSSAITPPEREDFLKVALKAGLTSTVGGEGTTDEAVVKVALPTKDSRFTFDSARTEIVWREDGEPQQILFLTTQGFAAPSVVAGAVELWKLPKKEPAKNPDGTLEEEAAEWKGPGEVDQNILARAKRVTLTPVPPASPVTTEHAFQFLDPEPGTFLVRVAAGMPALGGFRLGAAYAGLAPVAEFPREVTIVGEGGVLALGGERKLSVKSRGVDHVRYTVARVPAGQINHLVSQTRGDFASPHFRNRSFDQDNLAHFHRSVQQVGKRNSYEANYTSFDFSTALRLADAHDPDPSRGLFFLDLESVRPREVAKDGEPPPGMQDPKWIAEDEEKDENGNLIEHDEGTVPKDSRFLLVTDLGLLVKSNADDTRHVFVMSLKAGGPVREVRVTALAVNGEPLAEAVTDIDGHALLPALSHLEREKRPVAVVARKGNDLAFIPWNRDERKLDLSNFDVGGVRGSEVDALDAFLFTERGIFRPGDMMHVGVVVRRRDWQALPEDLALELEVRDSKDAVMASLDGSIDADGFGEFSVEVAETQPTGVYTLLVYLAGEDDERRCLGTRKVRVEDFQPDRMKLTPAFNRTAPGWLAPTDLRAQLTLETLFGLPAEGRTIKGKLTFDPAGPSFQSFPGFNFRLAADLAAHAPRDPEIDLGEVKTDARGQAEFSLHLERFAGASYEARVELEGFEPDGGRSVRGSLRTLISPLPQIVGWKADGDLGYVGKDTPRSVRFVAIGPDLRAVELGGLTRRLLEIRHVSVLSKNTDGGYHYVSTAQENELESAPFAIGAAETTLALPTANAGHYRTELVDAAGQVVAAVSHAVAGAGNAGRSLEKNAELELSLARPAWNPGETVAFNVRAPFTGAGLITLEREKVLGWKWFSSATTSFDQAMALPAAIEGPAFLGVSFVRALDSPEIFTSPLSYAVAPFTVDPRRRRFEVALEAPAVVRPGEPMTIGFRAAKKSRIVVFAVDEGIHQITNYTLPQPLEFFFQKRALEVGTSQLLDQIMPEFSILGRSRAFGGDGGEADPALKLGLNPFKRKKDAPVVFWSGVIEATPERREVTYEVPDYFAGRLAIMAVAVAPDAVGAAATQSTVRGPFVITPNVPTFVAPDDEFTASVTVANLLDGHQGTSAVTIAAQPSEHLEIVESPAGPLDLPPGKEATARFRVRARPILGGAQIAFTVSAAGESASQRSTLSVRPAAPFMTHVRSGYFRQAEFEQPVSRDVFPQFAQRRASVAPLPLGLAAGLAEYLEKFPYGCSEQITSQSMARLLLTDLPEFGIDRAEATRQLDHTFALLRSRQGANGSVGYWDAAGTAAGLDWLSVYVSHFALEAKPAGFEPPPSLVAGLARRLQEMAKLPVTTRAEAAIQAHAIYLLTANGQVTTNYVLNLRDTLDSKFKGEWQADLTGGFLAATLSLLQQKPEAEELMRAHRGAAAQAAVSGSGTSYYESPLAHEAQSLALLCKHFPALASAIGYDQLRPIIDPLERGQFSTVSSAWAILALKAYSTAQSTAATQLGLAELPRAGGPPQLLVPARSGMVSATFSENSKAIVFQLVRPAGAPDLGAFYQTVETGFDRVPPAQPVSDGLEAVQELVGANGAVVGHLRVGDGALLRVRVRNLGDKALTHLAVLNLLPAGFEIEHGSLKPGRHTVAGAEFVEVREDRNIFFCDLAARAVREFSFRVKPTCAGKFVVPPGFAESMYLRDLKGRGVAARIEVQNRE